MLARCGCQRDRDGGTGRLQELLWLGIRAVSAVSGTPPSV